MEPTQEIATITGLFNICVSFINIHTSWLLIIRRNSNISEQLMNSHVARIFGRDAHILNEPVIHVISCVNAYLCDPVYIRRWLYDVGSVNTRNELRMEYARRRSKAIATCEMAVPSRALYHARQTRVKRPSQFATRARCSPRTCHRGLAEREGTALRRGFSILAVHRSERARSLARKNVARTFGADADDLRAR